MKKRVTSKILSCALALALAVCLCPVTAYAATDFPVGNLSELDNALSTGMQGDTITMTTSFAITANRTIPAGCIFYTSDYSLTISPTITLSNNGTITIGSSGALINNGIIDTDGDIANSGTITNNRTITNSGTIINDGTLTHNGNGGKFNNKSGAFITNNGTLEFIFPGTPDTGGNHGFTSAGIISGSGAYTGFTYIKFDANGGDFGGGAGENIVPVPISPFNINSAPVPVLAGSGFSGWFTEATGGTKMVGSYTLTSTVTFYAQWGGAPSTRTSRGNSGTTRQEIPSSAFRWDGRRSLTVDQSGVTPAGLERVLWDGAETTAFKAAASAGGVMIEFDQSFIGAQTPGEHTVRVQFPDYSGSYTVTLSSTASTANPNTGLPESPPWRPGRTPARAAAKK